MFYALVLIQMISTDLSITFSETSLNFNKIGKSNFAQSLNHEIEKMICKKLIDYIGNIKDTKNKEEYKETPINNYLCQKAGVKTTSKVKISSLPKIIAKDKILFAATLSEL